METEDEKAPLIRNGPVGPRMDMTTIPNPML